MNKLLIVLLTLLFNVQQASAMNVDAFMDKHIAPISDAVASWIFVPIKLGSSEVPLIILWVLAAGIFFTIFFNRIIIISQFNIMFFIITTNTRITFTIIKFITIFYCI